MKKLLSVLCVLFLSACGDTEIPGTWLQPIPGMEDKTQGFTLNDDGTAQSVNMATLQYTTWRRDGDILTLTDDAIMAIAKKRKTDPPEEEEEEENESTTDGEEGGE